MDWKCVFVILTVQIGALCVFSFNVEVRSPKQFWSENNDSSFGQSVLLQKGLSPILIVGAPKAQSTFSEYPNRTGSFYQCDLNSTNGTQCTEYNLGLGLTKKDFQLLGTSIDGGDSTIDRLVVCAPRWYQVVNKTDANPKSYYTNGICYLNQNSSSQNGPFQVLNPLSNGSQMMDEKFWKAMGQLGLSVNYNKDNILMGAPGIMSWKGSVVQLDTQNNKTNITHPDEFGKDLIDDDSYLGYSLTSGKFIDDKLWYAAGAPKGASLCGQVFIFEYPRSGELTPLNETKGPDCGPHGTNKSFGSYFGGSLATAKLGDDQLNLVVGAPTYSGETYDEGIVYVYKYSKEQSFEKVFELDGTTAGERGERDVCRGRTKTGSRFGAAISNLGLQSDGNFDSIAISAPFENNGKGVVYIYLGNSKKPICSQRIEGSTINVNMQRFGYSLSRGVDIDGNNHTDLAIGSKGTVAFFKSRPVIKLIANISSTTKILYQNSTNLEINFCIKLDPLRSDVNKVPVKYALRFNTLTEYLNTSKVISEYCEDVSVTLDKSNTNFIYILRVELRYNLEDCENCPMVSPFDEDKKVLEIPYVTGCGDDMICQYNLTIESYFEQNPILVGNLSTIKLLVNISNAGEPAHMCRINLTLPDEVGFRKCPASCRCDYNAMDCAVANPLTYLPKVITFDLELANLSRNSLNFTIKAKSIGENLNDRLYIQELQLKYDFNATILGHSGPNDVLSEDTSINHTFTFINQGISPLKNYKVFFTFPVGPKGVEEVPFEVKVDSDFYTNNHDFLRQLTCMEHHSEDHLKEILPFNIPPITSDDLPERSLVLNCTNMECLTFACSGNVLHKSQSANVRFQINLKFKKLIEHFEKQIKGGVAVLVLSSSGYSRIGNTSVFGHASTLVHLDEVVDVGVKWPFILLAVISAALLLGLIVLILYLCNFFKRTEKPKEYTADVINEEEPINH